MGNQGANVGNQMRTWGIKVGIQGMKGIRGIRVGMQVIRVGMQEMGVGMKGIRVILRENSRLCCFS